MNRGSAAQEGPQGRQGVPSMRPRFMNRGSTRFARPADGRSAPFNEAPIHESGKFRISDSQAKALYRLQ